MSVKVTVKCNNGTKFDVDVEVSKTVREFKEMIVGQAGVSTGQMRLIHRGHVLKDGSTLESYALEEGHTVHLVAGAEPSAASPSSASSASPAGVGAGGMGGGSPAGGFGGMGGMMGMGGDPASMQQQMMQNPDAMRAMLNSPMVQQMLDNPEVLRGIIQSNPQLQAIIEQNPEFGHVLNDPAMLRQSLEMARSPSLMREMTRNTDRAMSNIESHPEGFNMLRRMYTNVQEPLMEAATRGGGLGSDSNAAGSRAPAVDPSNPFAELFATPVVPSGGASGTTPNPWAPSQPATSPSAPSGGGGGAGLGAGLGGFGGMGGMGGGFPGMGGLGGMGGMEEMMNNPAMMEQMTQAMQNPMMQQMLQDPAFFDQMVASNPQLAAMVEQNPHIREMMRSPELLQQLSNPQVLQEMMRMRQAMGGGAGMGGMPPMGGGMPGMGGMGGLFGGLGAGSAAPGTGANSGAPPEERFREQLTALRDMGFSDQDSNIRALTATGGNVEAAVDRLLSGGFL